MEYRQTPLALVSRAVTTWWWLGIMTLGILIVTDVLSYKRTKLVLKDRSLSFESGVMTQNSRELAYRNIQTVDLNQSAMGQIFGYGHIIITTANAEAPITFKYVGQPQVVRSAIQAKLSAI